MDDLGVSGSVGTFLPKMEESAQDTEEKTWTDPVLRRQENARRRQLYEATKKALKSNEDALRASGEALKSSKEAWKSSEKALKSSEVALKQVFKFGVDQGNSSLPAVTSNDSQNEIEEAISLLGGFMTMEKRPEWHHQCSSIESSVQETSSKISNDHSKGKSKKEIMKEKRSNPEFRIKENEGRRQVNAAKKNSQATIAKQMSSKLSQVNIKSETDNGEFSGTSENISILKGLNNFEHPNYSTEVDSRQIIEVNFNKIKQENTPRESDGEEPSQTLQHESQEWNSQCSSVESSILETPSKISKKSKRERMREKRSNPEFRIKENERRRQIRADMKNSQATIAKQMSSELSQMNIKSEPHNGEFSDTSENFSILKGLSNFEHPKVESRQIIEVNFNTIKQEITTRASDDEEPFQTLQHESQEWNPQCSSIESSIHETPSKISKGKSKKEILRGKRSRSSKLSQVNIEAEAHHGENISILSGGGPSNLEDPYSTNDDSRPIIEVDFNTINHENTPRASDDEEPFQTLQHESQEWNPQCSSVESSMHETSRKISKVKSKREVMRKKRSNPEFRIKENERKRLFRQRKKQDPIYQERERERQRLVKQRKRQDPNYLERKRERQRLMQRRKRQDPNYRERERERLRLMQQRKRQDPNYQERERERERERRRLMERLRNQDPNYRESERERIRLLQRRKRQDPNYREKERERQRLMQRLKREDPAYAENERIKNRLRQQLHRQDPSYLQNERIKNRLRQQLLRQDRAHLEKNQDSNSSVKNPTNIICGSPNNSSDTGCSNPAN